MSAAIICLGLVAFTVITAIGLWLSDKNKPST